MELVKRATCYSQETEGAICWGGGGPWEGKQIRALKSVQRFVKM